MPIIPPPLQVASNENVVVMATTRGISRFTIPSLAEFGHLSLQPATSGFAEPAATAMEVVAMATDPTEDLFLLYLVLKNDTIHVDDD